MNIMSLKEIRDDLIVRPDHIMQSSMLAASKVAASSETRAAAAAADAASAPVQRVGLYREQSITMALLRCTGRLQKWHAPLPPAPAAVANIAAACGYSGRGRRPERRDAVCAPF